MDFEWDEEYWRIVMEQGEAVTNGAFHGDEAGMRDDVRRAPTSAMDTSAEEPPADSAGDARRALDIWGVAAECLREGRVLELPVVGYNRGGLLVQWNDRQAFVPASHLIGMPRSANFSLRQAYLAGRVGETLRLCIIEADASRNRIVLSEREAFSEGGADLDAAPLALGQRRHGRVTAVQDFGIFVDVGEMEGLVHISELSWQRVRHPSDLFRVGDDVEVLVLSVDRPNRRAGLSIKQLLPDPWARIEDCYQVGQVVRGRVTGVMDFGVFVEIQEGVEGLIHVSELAEGALMHPRGVVQEGTQVVARIISIEPEKHRIALSMRDVSGAFPALPA